MFHIIEMTGSEDDDRMVPERAETQADDGRDAPHTPKKPTSKEENCMTNRKFKRKYSHVDGMTADRRSSLTRKGDPVMDKLREILTDVIDADRHDHSGFIASAGLGHREQMHVLEDDNLHMKTIGHKRWAFRCLYSDSEKVVVGLDSKAAPSGVPLREFFDCPFPRTGDGNLDIEELNNLHHTGVTTVKMFEAMISAHRPRSGADLKNWAQLWGWHWEPAGRPGRFLLTPPNWAPGKKRSAMIKWLHEMVGTPDQNGNSSNAPVCKFANKTSPNKSAGRKNARNLKVISTLNLLLPLEFALVEANNGMVTPPTDEFEEILDSAQYEFASGLTIQLRKPEYYTEEEALELPRLMEIWDAKCAEELAGIKENWKQMVGTH